MLKILANNSFILLFSQFSIYAIQFLIVWRLLFVLGLETYGLVAFSQAFIAVFIMFLDFGFSVSAVNKVSKYQKNKKYIGYLFTSVIAVKLAFFAFGAVLVVLFVSLNDSYSIYDEILLASLLFVLVNSISPAWFFYGTERFFYYSLYSVLGKLFFAILIFIFIDTPFQYTYVPIFAFISQIIILIYSALVFYRGGYAPYLRLNLRFVRYTLNFTKGFIASRLALSFNTSSGILFLGLVASPSIVGFFSLGDQIYRVLQTFVGSIAVPLYSRASRTNDVRYVVRVSALLMLLITALCFAFFLVKIPILDFFEFDKSDIFLNLLNFFIIIFWINSFSTLIGYPLYAAISRLYIVNLSVIVSSLVYFSLLTFLFLTNTVSIEFVMYSLFLCEFYILAHRLIYFSLHKKFIKFGARFF